MRWPSRSGAVGVKVRTARAWPIVMVAAGALVLATASGLARPAPAVSELPVTSADLTCPAIAAGRSSGGVVATNVVPGMSQGPGTAALKLLSKPVPLAGVAAPDTPLVLEVSGQQPAPIQAIGAQGWAPALLAGQAVRVARGPGSGLVSGQCPAAAAQWWFVGAGTALGQASVLHVTNPSDEPARFDISLIGRAGQVDPVAGRGLDIAARTGLKLGLDALAPGEDLLAVHVSATAGRVAVSVSERAAPVADQPRGIDLLGPSALPGRQLVLAGIPAGAGRRSLVLVNPTDVFATAAVSAITDSGRGSLPGLATVAVPARGIVSVDLAGVLGGRSTSLVLDSDQPITGSVLAAWGAARRDSMWLTATPAVEASTPLAGAAVIPAGPTLRTTVTVTAAGAAVFGSLNVLSLGAAGGSVFQVPAGEVSDSPEPDIAVVPPTGESAGGDPPQRRRVRINVPAGSQRQLTLSDLGSSGSVLLYWLAEAGSGPAHISHTTLDVTEDAPLATGYQWWPTVSAVPAVPVTNDPAVLVGIP